MYYSFQLSGQRRVTEANYNTFVSPVLHPDRTMQQHDFLYIVEGDWEVALEQERECAVFGLRKDDLLILPAGIHHYGTRPCDPNSRNMYIHTETAWGDRLENSAESSMETDGETGAQGSMGMDGENSICSSVVMLPLLVHCGGNIKIRQYFSEIVAVYWSDSLYKDKRLSSLFELLLCEIGEQEIRTPVTSKCAAFVGQIAQFLQENPEKFFSVSEISRRFCVSEKTLNKRFKIVYDKTFYAWQMDQKLEMVYQALKNNSDITLKETAVNFGFYDEFHLSRAFKKKFGVAPKYAR